MIIHPAINTLSEWAYTGAKPETNWDCKVTRCLNRKDAG
ncbi:hypothetical protein HPTD01_3381 [Halomonas sp. TD01]|nr:hypothetical protein HPTD01_3381 [Halomonas sp. TD01]